MKRGSLSVLAVMVGMAVAGASPAGAAESEFWQQTTPNNLGTAGGGGPAAPNFNTVDVSLVGVRATSAGQFTANFWNPADGPPTDLSFLRMFCIERESTSGLTEQYFRRDGTGSNPYIAPFLTAGVVDNLRKLYDLYYPRGSNPNVGDFYNAGKTDFGKFENVAGPGTGEGSGLLDAAFQLAVWEIAFDTDVGFNLNSGDVYVISASTTNQATIKSTAATYLAGVTGYTGTGYLQWSIYQFTNTGQSGFQDFVTATYKPGDESQGAPEPGTLALLGLGLAGLAAARRRRQ